MDFSEVLIYIFGFFGALIIMLIVMPGFIRYLHKIKFGQTEREEGLQSHKVKNGTPTMGGIAFILVPVLLYGAASCFSIVSFDMDMLIILLAFVGYGLIGFIDDYIIVVKKDNTGLKPSMKFLMQSVLAIVFYLMYVSHHETTLWIPLLNVSFDIGLLYFFLIFFMFTAETNAVNLTDGLDGLCAGQMIIALIPFGIFSWLAGYHNLVFFLVLVIGALFGYLYFNKHPAKIFMGDTGSLALGGLLAGVAMILKQEILLILIGFVFVMEVLSVVIQVTYYKRTKKRIFKMAPLHHHFELSGWSETQVVHRFWLAGVVFALIGLWMGVH